MQDWEKHQLVITGASGLGKSALVANWTRDKLAIRGDSHPEVAQSYRQLSFVYHALGYEQKELEYREKALAIQPSLPFDDDLPVAKDALQVPQSVETAQSHAADIHSALDDSLALLDTTLSTYGENSLEAAESFAKVGKLYGIIDDNRSALDYEQRALKIYISHFGEHDSNVARLYNNLGCRYGNLGDTAKEIEFRKKGLMIALSLEDDELSAALYGLVGLAYKSVGKKSTANGYFRKAAERFRHWAKKRTPRIIWMKWSPERSSPLITA